MKIIMNPIRMRIIQYFLLTEAASTAQVKAELTDIPHSSLYRHMRVLEEAGFLIIIQENRIRGAVENIYKLNPTPFDSREMTPAALSQTVAAGLFHIMGSFLRYFEKEDCDMLRDMFSLSTSTLLMTDEEYVGFSQKLGALLGEYIHNRPEDGRKIRRLTIISSPSEEDE